MDVADWLQIVLPALVGAGSAIMSSWLTNRYSERRHNVDISIRKQEMDQKMIESLIPNRTQAYSSVYTFLEKMKMRDRISTLDLEIIDPHMLWLDSDLGDKLANLLVETVKSGKDIRKISEMQELLRMRSGSHALEARHRIINQPEG